MEFIPNEKATVIRYPSTANLMLDSADRPDPASTATGQSAFDFQISKTNSIMNGFFTRIGTTEVVLEWCEPNITTGNDSMIVDVSGTGANTFNNTLIGYVPSGIFSTVEAVLDELVDSLNVDSGIQGAGVTFEVVNDSPGRAGIRIQSGDPGVFRILPSDNTDTWLPDQLGIYKSSYTTTGAPTIYVDCPDLRLYRYLDFTSSQLTYNQDLKDTTTSPIARDVLCRWYMAWDTPPEVDAYGFPILMGYTPFTLRRLFNPPKQIKWDPRQPIGNLAFQVYGGTPFGQINAPIVQNDVRSNWLMTLQVSEV